MRIDVLTLFPEMFDPILGSSILKRASEAKLVSYHTTNIRDYTANKHNKVDERPYGGGPGMVMTCQPLWDCVEAVEAQDPDLTPRRLLMTPQGRKLDQPLAEELAQEQRLLIIAGHYEGIDERVIQRLDPLEVSIGDYVLSGGELPAMVLIDTVVRLIPGALGHDESAYQDSFSPGADRLLDHPHYTRPPEWEGMSVPEVLQNGDHAKIEAWRQEAALQRTRERRPDLLNQPEADTQE
ncbi:MAG: tRNA (guanosine(37)-N1)-methyltransferase TrmD [Planctomycetota bacterium]|jgi:tRNA (guanine37-N1)-methyltransferase